MLLRPRLHNAEELSENGVFTPKMPEEVKKRDNQRSLWICVLRKTRAGKSRDYCDVFVFEKLLFSSKCLPSTLRQNAGVFKFLQFEGRFVKAPFS